MLISRFLKATKRLLLLPKDPPGTRYIDWEDEMRDLVLVVQSTHLYQPLLLFLNHPYKIGLTHLWPMLLLIHCNEALRRIAEFAAICLIKM